MTDLNKIVDFTKYVLTNLCENEEDVSLELTEDEQGSLILAKVNKEDMGRVIGKEGRIVNSLRNLIGSMSGRYDVRVHLKIEEIEQ